MALGASWGCFWLVLGAPEGLLRVALASVKPISTIKTAFPSFDVLFSLAVVNVVVVVVLGTVSCDLPAMLPDPRPTLAR